MADGGGSKWNRPLTPEELAAGSSSDGAASPASAQLSGALSDDARRKRDRARQAFKAAAPIAGTLAEEYLAGRGIPSEKAAAFPDVIRFDQKSPALIVAVRSETGEIEAVQRTFLKPDGRAVKEDGKTRRRSLGSVSRGYVRIDAPGGENVLAIAEGLETSLSRLAVRPASLRVCLGPPRAPADHHGYQRVEIIADADKTDHARKLASQMARPGRPVHVVAMPSDLGPKADLNDALQSGGVSLVREIVASAEEIGLREAGAIEVIWGADTSKPILDDLFSIQGVIPLRGIGAMYGSPGSGKSFAAIAMAYAIARGVSFLDRETERGRVIYCALEGCGVFPNRLAAYVREQGLTARDQALFGLCTAKLDLRTVNGHGPQLTEIVNQYRETERPVRLVIIDTLNRSFAGGNENSPEDMGAFVAQVEEVAESGDVFVLIIHHCGKDLAAGLRGHSSLLGAVDTELKLERNDAGRILTVSKQRDGEDGLQLAFDLKAVELGKTPKGRPVTSAVLVEADLAEVKAAAQKAPTGKNQKAALRAIETLVAEPGVKRNPAGPGWPETGRFPIVNVEDVIEHAKGLLDPPEEGKRDRRVDCIGQALDALVDRGAVGRNQGFVWASRKAGSA